MISIWAMVCLVGFVAFPQETWAGSPQKPSPFLFWHLSLWCSLSASNPTCYLLTRSSPVTPGICMDHSWELTTQCNPWIGAAVPLPKTSSKVKRCACVCGVFVAFPFPSFFFFFNLGLSLLFPIEAHSSGAVVARKWDLGENFPRSAHSPWGTQCSSIGKSTHEGRKGEKHQKKSSKELKGWKIFFLLFYCCLQHP